MSDKPIEPLDPDTLERIRELMSADIERIPREYNRWKIYATYHRIFNLLKDHGEQTPQVGKEEIEDMKIYRKNGFSYHDIAYIFRRSPSSVHASLKDLILDEAIQRL